MGINWNEKNIYDAIGRPDLKPLTKEEMETKVCAKCGNRDNNYGDTGCDQCELYDEDFESIEKWKYEWIKFIKDKQY